MKKYIFAILVICLFANTPVFAGKPNCHIRHYGLTDGLPQRTVMSILQDKKGFMWFSTWDGLCKFDGYNFTAYKSNAEDSVSMKTNRSDKICEDKYGDIWVHSYNRETYRFNPRTKKYTATFKYKDAPFLSTKILPMPSGKVWLTSETMGCISVLDSTNAYINFNADNSKLQGNNVTTVLEDSNSDSWILTNNGLTFFSGKGDECVTYFAESKNCKENTPFFSAIEFDDEIWFGANNGRIWRYLKKDEKFSVFETGVLSNIISINKISNNSLIILTANDGFFICNKDELKLTKYDKTNLRELPSNEMVSCYVDQSKNIWIETKQYGVAKFDFHKNSLRFYVPKSNLAIDMVRPPHFSIIEDNSGRIWVHLRGGGFSYYDKTTDSLHPFYNDPSSSDWKFSHMLHDAFLDRQGNLWLATRSDGLEKVVFDNEYFHLNFFGSSNESFSNNEARAIFQDKDKNVWLGYKDGMIRVFDQSKKFVGILCDNGTISQKGDPIKGQAYCFLQDKYDNIWIGTKAHGLYMLTPDYAQNHRTYRITRFVNEAGNLYSLSHNSIYSIAEDNKGQIWIGTYGGGLNLFDKNNNRFINHRNNMNKYPIDMGYQIRSVDCDQKGFVYVGTTFGLIAFSTDYERPELIDYRIYTRQQKQKDGIKANDIFDIYVTANDDVYIAAFGGGLSKVIERDNNNYPTRFKTYNTSNGLPSDVILSVIDDKNGNLWISSEGNLSKLNTKNESVEIFSDVSRLLDNEYFSEAAAMRTHSGEIIFGCAKGTISFDPDKITKSDFVPYMALTKFRVSNKEIPLTDKIDDTRKVELKHNENFFSIEYVALDYTNPQNIMYAYRLDGFDKEWIFNQGQRAANYTNIAPGDYVFKVRSTNSNGNWTDNEHTLHITIHPSFWQTKWAYSLYLILFVLVLFIILRSLFVFYRMRDRVTLEQEQTEMKTRFFTDISHEIRTPLTMIVSPVENIIENEKTPEEVKPQLNLILKNANRMLDMVNQILDFRKIQKQRLKVREVEIGNYVTQICNTFFKTADAQGINLVVNNEIGSDKIWIDRDSVEKLIFNLISNAIKYTNTGKSIEVSVFRKDKMIAFQVKDEGSGMTKEVQNKLFTRFASFNTDKSKPSTGIGLSIVKEVADKHHAKIQVNSEVGEGSCFTILFNSGLEHFAEDDNIEIINLAAGFDPENPFGTEEYIDNKRVSMLVVEDDVDLREFIKTILEPYYKVYEAGNGKEGYEVATKNLPDFILSDIMMPEMDGIELLQKIREDNNTSHIPFILLTAKTNIDDKLQGITYGADDYITKPFNVKLLKAKIESIFQQRKRFYDFFNTGKKEEIVESTEKQEDNFRITTQDELFIQQLQNEVMKNLDNSDFLIEDLVATTQISRTLFFKKLKSLTGLAPIEFVREIRIKHAAELLQSRQYMVKEVSFMVGFQDIKYFTQCFKRMYGLTPSQFKEQFD